MSNHYSTFATLKYFSEYNDILPFSQSADKFTVHKCDLNHVDSILGSLCLRMVFTKETTENSLSFTKLKFSFLVKVVCQKERSQVVPARYK